MILDILLWPFMIVYHGIASIFIPKKKNKENVKAVNDDMTKDSNIKRAINPNDFNKTKVISNSNGVNMEFETPTTLRSRKKKVYNYTILDKKGKKKTGSMNASTEAEVTSFLMSQEYQIKEIKEDKLSTSLGLASIGMGRMRDKRLSFFLTQLSTYIKSGIPLVDSVNILSRQSKKKREKVLYQKLVFELNAGVTFSEALAKQGNVFPRILINMVKTSELTGNLTDVLDDMAVYFKRNYTNQKQIKSAMTYPVIVLIFALCILVFMLLYVVPQFKDMYSEMGMELPWITTAVLTVSRFLENNFIVLLLSVVTIIVILVIMYKNVASVRYFLQYIVMHIPVIKNITIYNEMVMFTSTFSSLIKHDVFITDSMEILGKITNNEIFKLIIKDAVTNLSNGNGISPAFNGHWAFPSVAYEMLLTGEKTGKLGEMMENVANYYEEEQKNLVNQLKSLIEPVMIVSLAFIVGIIVLSIVVPMFDMYGGIM